MDENVDDARARGKSATSDQPDALHGDISSGSLPATTSEALRLALDDLGRQREAVASLGACHPEGALRPVLERGALRRLGFAEAAVAQALARVRTLERRCRVLREAVAEGGGADAGAREPEATAGGTLWPWEEPERGTFFGLTEKGRAALAG
jgi:hypothetical protein